MAPLADVLRDRPDEYSSAPEKYFFGQRMGAPGMSAQQEAYEMQKANAADAIAEAYNFPEDVVPVSPFLKALKLGGMGMLAAGALIPKNAAAKAPIQEIRKAFAPAALSALETAAARKGKVFSPGEESIKDILVDVQRDFLTYLKRKKEPVDPGDLFWSGSIAGNYRPKTPLEQEAGILPEIFVRGKDAIGRKNVSTHEGAHALLPKLRPSTAQMLRRHYLKRDPKEMQLETEFAGGDPYQVSNWLADLESDPQLATMEGVAALQEIFAREMQGALSAGPAARHLLSREGRMLGDLRFVKPKDLGPPPELTLEGLLGDLEDQLKNFGF